MKSASAKTYNQMIIELYEQYKLENHPQNLFILKQAAFMAYIKLKNTPSNSEEFIQQAQVIDNFVAANNSMNFFIENSKLVSEILGLYVDLSDIKVEKFRTQTVAFQDVKLLLIDTLLFFNYQMDHLVKQAHAFLLVNPISTHLSIPNECLNMDHFVDFTFPDLYNEDGTIKQSKKWSFGESNNSDPSPSDLNYQEDFDAVDPSMFEDASDADKVTEIIKGKESQDFKEQLDISSEIFIKYLEIADSESLNSFLNAYESLQSLGDSNLNTIDNSKILKFNSLMKIIEEIVIKLRHDAARHFDHRLQCLFRDILLSDIQPLGAVRHYMYRIEFQQRGSPHAHCVLWVKYFNFLKFISEELITSC